MRAHDIIWCDIQTNTQKYTHIHPKTWLQQAQQNAELTKIQKTFAVTKKQDGFSKYVKTHQELRLAQMAIPSTDMVYFGKQKTKKTRMSNNTDMQVSIFEITEKAQSLLLMDVSHSDCMM